MSRQNILIIEDDANWQNIFSEIITDFGFRAIPASTYQAALAALTGQTYALAIVDISLSASKHADRGGVELLKQMARLPGKLPAVVVTGYATVDLAIETLVELNAVHFFRKDKFDRRKFARVIKKEAVKRASAPAGLNSPEAGPDVLKTLSKREEAVLALLIQGRTNKEIAEVLTISVNTVKKHVQSIFTKFNVDNRASAVARALDRK